MNVIIRQLRPHQWVKNVLLFAPMILAHQIGDITKWIDLLAAFVAFCFTASAIYTINDLTDTTWDQTHPTKKMRPIASGALSMGQASILIAVLLTAAATIVVVMELHDFLLWLLAYLAVTTLYTVWLRRLVLIDVLVLALLYALRIVAGAEAVDVAVSPWLLAFSLFLFTSLAFLKRFTELRDTIEREGRKVSGRGYHVGDADFIKVTGPSLGFMAVVVFVLYLNSKEVGLLYTYPERLWLVVPIVLYWVTRIWLKAYRGRMHEDPIVFTVQDGASYVVAVLSIVVLQLAGPR